MTRLDDGFPMREAEYWESCGGRAVRCLLCPNRCTLGEGQRGLCRNRVNRGGRLLAEAYGRVCALGADPVEKKPLLHFHPGGSCLSLAAAGCNLSCLNCQNWDISQASAADVPYRLLGAADVARLAETNGCRMVAYTYTEPLTWFEYTRDCAVACRERGLKNILVTAGYVNASPQACLLPYIDAANVDLKSFSDDIYRSVSGVRLAPVLHTLKSMLDAGVWIEITNLLIPGVNDDMDMIARMCRWLVDNGFADCPLHFSRFFPQYKMQGPMSVLAVTPMGVKDAGASFVPTPLPLLVEARRVAISQGMRHVYLGNVSLSGAEDTLCPSCGSVLIRRTGYDVDLGNFSGVCPKCGSKIAGVW